MPEREPDAGRLRAIEDEVFHALMNEATDLAILAMDPDRTIRAWSRGAERITGWSAEEANGQKGDLIFTPEDIIMGVPDHEASTAAREGRAEDERWHARKDRSRFWASGLMITVRSEDGNVRALVKVFKDATDRKLTEEALRTQASLIELSFDPIFVHRPDGTLLFWNAAAEREYGWAKDEAVGRSVHDLLRTEPSAPLEEVLRTVRASGTWEGEVVHTCRAGERKVMLSRWVIRRGAEGVGDDAILEMNRDITLRKETESRLEELVQERTASLVEKNEELEGFTYSVSHDMRSPLRAMVANARIVLDEQGPNLDEQGRENLERLSNAALKMATLVDDLLHYARLGKRAVIREHVDLSALARRVADDVCMEYHRCDIRVDVEPGMVVDCDPQLMALALRNLFDNACKYRQPDRPAEVTFGAMRGKGERVFFVRDRGIGFDMAYIDKLFQPFERLHRDSGYPGTGIGLANVRRSVERHGGRVWAESAPGEGASFYFTLGEDSVPA